MWYNVDVATSFKATRAFLIQCPLMWLWKIDKAGVSDRPNAWSAFVIALISPIDVTYEQVGNPRVYTTLISLIGEVKLSDFCYLRSKPPRKYPSKTVRLYSLLFLRYWSTKLWEISSPRLSPAFRTVFTKFIQKYVLGRLNGECTNGRGELPHFCSGKKFPVKLQCTERA